jgi:malonyl-CoA O-methyltransferase
MNTASPHVFPHVPDAAKAAVQPAALAHQYQRLASMPQPAWLHEEVGRRLADKLEVMRMQPNHWLDWGGWLGASHGAVAQRYPQATRWVWEPTAALSARSMQAAAASSLSQNIWWHLWRSALADGHKRVIQGEAPWPPNWPAQGVDLLWANMTLHAAADLASTLRRWHAALGPQGFLMCSGLGPDTGKELKRLYAQLDWPVPAASFLDMHDVGDALVGAGFAEPVMDMEHLTLTWPSAQRLLDELRTWGGNVAVGRFSGCRTPRWRERLLERLTEHLRTPDGQLALTVEVVYGHAIKPAPRVRVAPETKVSLSDMRRIIQRRPSGSA